MSLDADLPTALARKIVERSASFSSKSLEFEGFVPSLHHGRSVAIKMLGGGWVLAKGCGWSWGPPWCVVSPKDPELFFGLFDLESAEREIQVSAWLEAHEINAARSREFVALCSPDLQLLDIDQNACFRNDRPVKPVVLLTAVSSPYRVQDLLSEASVDARAELRASFDGAQPITIMNNFSQKLLTAIVAYQCLGAVNDTLGPENVTVAGEVVDFEWFFVPGVPLPDGWEDAQLGQRQKKEAFYLLHTLMVVAQALDLTVSVRSLARDAMHHIEDHVQRPPIVEQLAELAK